MGPEQAMTMIAEVQNLLEAGFIRPLVVLVKKPDRT